LFNGLVKFDKEGKIVGDLAQNFHFENDTTLIFELQEGLRWHDGVAVTSKDIVFTYNLLNSDKITTPYKDDFKNIRSVEALSQTKIKVIYKKPYFKALVIWMMGILPEHLWSKEGDPMTSRLNKEPVGTGPYIMKKAFGPNEQIVLEVNSYYKPHPPRIEKVVFHPIKDPMMEFISLKAHKLDLGSLDALQLERQTDEDFQKNYQIIEEPSYSYSYLGFNLRNEKFKDKRIREAISSAINKKELIDLLFFSHGKICNGPFMPDSDVYPKDVKEHIYNPQKAKEILATLGFDEMHPFEFELATNTDNDIRIYAAQILQHQLSKVGIKMRIRSMEWQAFLNTVVMPRDFEAVLLGWNLSLIPDAKSIWHSSSDKPGGFNLVGYKNSKIDKLIDEAEGMVDEERFAKNYKEIFSLIAEDKPYIFLYIPNSITAISKDIKGVEPSIIGIMHNQIEWEKEEK
ncbi:MAG: peptide-binding protein, partial [Campylobacterales bacterium]|nr:peptide-binding protein [Campylobacterales bacterium]